MSSSTTPRHERLLELLADDALGGLSPEERAELATLQREFPGENMASLEVAATSIELALSRGRVEPMPAHLAQKIEADAARIVRPNVIAFSSGAPRKKVDLGRAFAWFAAAACFAFAVGTWLARPNAPVAIEKPIAELREELLARPDTRRIEWKGTADPAGKEVSGDVVFNVREQRGYMRFKNLAANDPKLVQYQLWIFDKAQDERFPIDGGVFDVDARTGDVLVPIHAKLRVTGPTLFAVTIEKPGGVVVSKRERIVATATPS